MDARKELNDGKRTNDGPDKNCEYVNGVCRICGMGPDPYAEIERLKADNERLLKAAKAGFRDLLRFAPAHWRNQTDGEILLRKAIDGR